MKTSTPKILDQVSALAEEVRCRLLLLCEDQELTVGELQQIVRLPQSTVSRHLKTLVDCGWLGRRKEGTCGFYRLDLEPLGRTERRIWTLLRDELAATPAAVSDRRRLEPVLESRRLRSSEFFSTTAGEWDALRRELFGARFDLQALMAFLDPEWVVGDLGCGTGELSQALAPFVERVIAVDSSEAMLTAARARLDRLDNAEVRSGDLARLPLEDRSLDAATLFLVLHHVAEPLRVLREAARVLKPGGALVILDMVAHDREELRQRMGHVWLGFSDSAVRRLLAESGLGQVSVRPLGFDISAAGPALFVARARTPVEPSSLLASFPAVHESTARETHGQRDRARVTQPGDRR